MTTRNRPGMASPNATANNAATAATFTAGSLAAVKLPRALLASVSFLVLAIASIGYALTGSPSLAGIGPAPSALADNADANGKPPGPTGTGGTADVTPKQIAAMVDRLAARMKERPDDAEGWTMLARSYMVLGRPADAVSAYAKAAALRKDDADLLADWADALAASNNGRSDAESLALVERALAIAPGNVKALALAGGAAYDRGDFDGAVARWTQVAAALPPNSELAGQVQASIADARAKARTGGSGAAAAAPASRGGSPAGATPDAAPTTALAADPTSATPQASAEISGIVTVAPALAAKAAPSDTVFVFARAAAGSPIPLAVMRAKVSDLPLRFKLDDSMAMGPMARLSSATSVIVGARISKSGDPIAHDGDLNGQSKPMAPRGANVSIEINEVLKR